MILKFADKALNSKLQLPHEEKMSFENIKAETKNAADAFQTDITLVPTL